MQPQNSKTYAFRQATASKLSRAIAKDNTASALTNSGVCAFAGHKAGLPMLRFWITTERNHSKRI